MCFVSFKKLYWAWSRNTRRENFDNVKWLYAAFMIASSSYNKTAISSHIRVDDCWRSLLRNLIIEMYVIVVCLNTLFNLRSRHTSYCQRHKFQQLHRCHLVERSNRRDDYGRVVLHESIEWNAKHVSSVDVSHCHYQRFDTRKYLWIANLCHQCCENGVFSQTEHHNR